MENLIEGCAFVQIKHIKKDLIKFKRNKEDISGIFFIGTNKKRFCNYWFDYKDKDIQFVISVHGTGPQRILISEQELNFGTRHYFVCGCGRRVNSLYLPERKQLLKCSICYGLKHELCTINRNSSQGRVFYRANRVIKLMNQRADIKRVFYNKKFTKRYERYLKLCAKAGFDNIINECRCNMIIS